MKKYLILFLIYSNLHVNAQNDASIPVFQHSNDAPYNVPTPNQTDLGTYGIIPVSPYTGKADIKVPIFSTTQRDVPLDINITYDTSGLLLNKLPGWTGHNWTLNAGGAITRRVNGKPDEINYKGTSAGRDYFYQYLKRADEYTRVSIITNGKYNSIQEIQDEEDRLNKEKFTYYPDIDDEPYSPIELYKPVYENIITDMEYNEEVQMDYYDNYTNYFMSSNRNIGDTLLHDPSVSFGIVAGQRPYNHDTSADMFYFNFMGISGCFFYGNDGNWKVTGNNNIRVKFDVNDDDNYIENYKTEFATYSPASKQPKTIKGFTLIDENGNQYIFGGDKSSIEYSMSWAGMTVANYTEPWTAISWMLTEVRDRFNNLLYSFKYLRGNEILQIYNTNIHRDMSYDRKEGLIYAYNYSLDLSHTATVNTPLYLDEISILDGTKLVFNHSNIYKEGEAMQKIYPNVPYALRRSLLESTYPLLSYNQDNYDSDSWDYIWNTLNGRYSRYAQAYQEAFQHDLGVGGGVNFITVEKRFNLRQLNSIDIHYGGTNTANKSERYSFNYDFSNRMCLSSLVTGTDAEPIVYEFEYDKSDSIPSDYLTKKIDFGGFYNGVDYGTNNHNQCIIDSSYSKIGMLKKISYPTKGYSLIDYEQNTYSKYLSDDKKNMCSINKDELGCGLRIKSIINYDCNSIPVSQKKYEYLSEDNPNKHQSSGELYSTYKTSYNWDKGDLHYHLSVYNASLPMVNSYQPLIGYSNVREINMDGSYTSYTFSNFSNETDDAYICASVEEASPYNEYSNRSYMRGLLMSKTVIGADKDSLFHTEYKYSSDIEFNKQHCVATSCFVNDPILGIMGSRYKLFYFKPQIESVVSKTKYGKDWVTERTTYENNHFMMDLSDAKCDAVDFWKTLSETKKQGESTVKTVYTYPFTDIDLTHPINASNNNTEPRNYRAHRQLLQDFCLPVIGIQQFHDGILINGLKDIYRIDLVKPVIDYSIAYNSDSTMYNIMRKYISYSQKGEPTMIVDENGVMHSLYWNGFGKLIATAANGELQVDNLNTIDAIINANSSTIFTSKPIDAKFVEYDPHGNASRITSQNKATSVFEYDQHGRLVQTSVKTADGKKQTVNKYKYNYRDSQK